MPSSPWQATGYSAKDFHKRVGKTTFYHENGVVSMIAEINDGEFDGIVIRYHQNGELSESCYYIDGKKMDIAVFIKTLAK